jgi:hypothetical protein
MAKLVIGIYTLQSMDPELEMNVRCGACGVSNKDTEHTRTIELTFLTFLTKRLLAYFPYSEVCKITILSACLYVLLLLGSGSVNTFLLQQIRNNRRIFFCTARVLPKESRRLVHSRT